MTNVPRSKMTLAIISITHDDAPSPSSAARQSDTIQADAERRDRVESGQKRSWHMARTRASRGVGLSDKRGMTRNTRAW